MLPEDAVPEVVMVYEFESIIVISCSVFNCAAVMPSVVVAPLSVTKSPLTAP